VPDRWKGMNEDQLRLIREEQQRQIEEKKVFEKSIFSIRMSLFVS